MQVLGVPTQTTEPTVARESCVSSPVFTLGGATATKKLGKDRAFTFTHTFLGTKVDEIQGRFVSPDEVEGFAIYHFSGQDLCSAGRSKVNFSAKHIRGRADRRDPFRGEERPVS